MSEIILLSAPIIVSLLTQIVKSVQMIRLSTNKSLILRFFAATASFAGVVATAWATEGEIPVTEIETYAMSVVVFLATQVPYWFGRQS